MTERIKKAYDALTEAFIEGTLRHGNCLACACGNIIASACGIRLTDDMITYKGHTERKWEEEGHGWWLRRSFYRNGQSTPFNFYYPLEEFKDVVNEAGFTAEEFSRMENAFEGTRKVLLLKEEDLNTTELQYRSLCAVFDVLQEMDERANAEEQKLRLKGHPKLQVV